MNKNKAFRCLLFTPFLVAILCLHFACKKDPTSPGFKDLAGGAAATPTPTSSSSTPTVSSHAFVKQWGTFGTAVGQFRYPHFVAVDDNLNVYVTDYGNGRVQSFTSEGVAVTQWSSDHPQGIAVDNGGNIAVAQESNDIIQLTTANGVAGGSFPGFSDAVTWYSADPNPTETPSVPVTHICTWHSKGPVGLALDGAGDQYFTASLVADTGDCHVLNDFSRELFVDHISPHVITSVWASDTSSSGDNSNPMGVALDHTGTYAYFADSDNNYIIRVTIASSAFLTVGTSGSGNGQFRFPHGVAVDRSGNVYVADSTNYRIQVLDKDLNYITQFGSEGTGSGQFENPWGVTVDKNGYIYVVDAGNHRVEKFAP
jgi:DNA-binding beta-propeller fold protein YncE